MEDEFWNCRMQNKNWMIECEVFIKTYNQRFLHVHISQLQFILFKCKIKLFTPLHSIVCAETFPNYALGISSLITVPDSSLFWPNPMQNLLLYGRQPHAFPHLEDNLIVFKWKSTSFFSSNRWQPQFFLSHMDVNTIIKMEEYFFVNRRQSQYYFKGSMT